MEFNGWAIFADGDMVCVSDIKQLKDYFDQSLQFTLLNIIIKQNIN